MNAKLSDYYWFKNIQRLICNFICYGKCKVVLLKRKVFGHTSLADISMSFSPLGLILYVLKMQKKAVLL